MTAVWIAVGSSYAQFITVLVIFVLVLGVTAFTTRWIANYQKQQGSGSNMEIVETIRLSNTKYLQLVRAGETYLAIAVCKDTVTMLSVIPKEQLHLHPEEGSGNSRRGDFRSALSKAFLDKQGDVSGDKPEEHTSDKPEEL